jgi:hypothetical protein
VRQGRRIRNARGLEVWAYFAHGNVGVRAQRLKQADEVGEHPFDAGAGVEVGVVDDVEAEAAIALQQIERDVER